MNPQYFWLYKLFEPGLEATNLIGESPCHTEVTALSVKGAGAGLISLLTSIDGKDSENSPPGTLLPVVAGLSVLDRSSTLDGPCGQADSKGQLPLHHAVSTKGHILAVTNLLHLRFGAGKPLSYWQ